MSPGSIRKNRILLFAALVFLLISGSLTPVIAEDGAVPLAAPPSPAEAKEGRISLDLRNIDLVDALKFLSLKAGMNIVPTQKVTGRVTLTVDNVPIADVFDIMLRSNSLAYDKKGEIYNVMTEVEYRSLYGKNFTDTRKVKIFHIRYAIPAQVFHLLDAVKSEIGRLLVEEESGTVLLMDIPEKIEEAQGALEAMEKQSDVKIFSLQYAKAKDVEDALTNQLNLKKIGYIKADDRTNQVIVQTLPDRMKNIEELIRGLDKKTKGVLVETKIIKITLTDNLSTGIEWEGLFQLLRQKAGMAYIGSTPFSLIQTAAAASAATGWQSRFDFYKGAMNQNVGAYPFSGTTTALNSSTKVSPGEAVHVGVVNGRQDFDVLIKFLQTFGKTKIISNPTLSVLDNKEANIHIGERRAYITTTTTTGGSSTTTAEEVTFIDTGVRLSITPTINDNGYVTMKVKPEISSVIGNVETPGGNKIPILDTATAETTVIAKDGATIILGGLGSEQKTNSSYEVPFLGKIPLLGALLFSSRTSAIQRTELVILLTPVIFEGDKMVSVKDKENEKYGLKEKKQFDAFKFENEGIPPDDASKKMAIPIKEEMTSTPNAEEITANPTQETFQPQSPAPEEKEALFIKGFRPSDISAVKKEIAEEEASKMPVSVKPEEIFKPKGFKSYD